MSGVRRLGPPDIPGAMRLKEAAGWNQTEEDWRRILELEPEGCFGIEQDGRLVATATAICYGRELAWIGMVLTDPEFRGQGLAGQLLRQTLDFLDSRSVECVKLDATDMGRGLYRKFGFVDECAVERWVRAPSPAATADIAGERGFDREIDLRAFGAVRIRLLMRLAAGESISIPRSGYAMGRPGSNAAYFGPCVASSRATARSLVEWFLARHSEAPVYWDLLPQNPEAVALAENFGFQRIRQLVRMARGNSCALQQNVREVYAIAGFEFG
jgi:GNAT superfamily N-acetyltransferase